MSSAESLVCFFVNAITLNG